MSSSSSSFRTIAPANTHMDTHTTPRRAKRLHSHSVSPPQDIPPSSDLDDLDIPPPKRRGRRPGTLSRAAREAQRKINHSLIEKARRTKINDALATLRELVPPEYKRPSDNQPDDNEDDDDDEDLDPKKPRPKSKPSGEKEFKLEILVRTVAYLQDLTDKVNKLEHNGCPRCSEPISLSSSDTTSRKRRREDVASSRCSSVPPHSRLPSISTWLPSSAEDQRSLLLTPSQSPTFDASISTRSTQLPTPPTSATCPPATNGFPIPPVLTLPSPSTFLPPTMTHMQPRFSGFTPRGNARSSPFASPVYTPDDETAASLLLRISTTSPRILNGVRPAEPESKHALGTGYALTPSKLLGLSAKR